MLLLLLLLGRRRRRHHSFGYIHTHCVRSFSLSLSGYKMMMREPPREGERAKDKKKDTQILRICSWTKRYDMQNPRGKYTSSVHIHSYALGVVGSRRRARGCSVLCMTHYIEEREICGNGDDALSLCIREYQL